MDKDILKGLADNPALFEAVRGKVLERFTFDYTYLANASNEDIGAITRAVVDGRQRIEAAFDEIASYKTFKESPEKPNPAR